MKLSLTIDNGDKLAQAPPIEVEIEDDDPSAWEELEDHIYGELFEGDGIVQVSLADALKVGGKITVERTA